MANKIGQSKIEKVADKYILELQEQLVELKDDVKMEILSEEHIKWIRKKILWEKMGIFEWIKWSFNIWKLNVFSVKKFTIAGKEYNSILDFAKELHKQIEDIKTEEELDLLYKNISQNSWTNDWDQKKDTKWWQEKLDDSLENESKLAGQAILNAVKIAINKQNYVSGKNCWDWVVNKIYKSAGVVDSKIIRVFQGEDYGNWVDWDFLDTNVDYLDSQNYEKLLDALQAGDHIIFHNNNNTDEKWDHSGIFVEWDSVKWKPYARIASLHKSWWIPDIKTYFIWQWNETKYNKPLGQIGVIRRPKWTVNDIDEIKRNLAQK